MSEILAKNPVRAAGEATVAPRYPTVEEKRVGGSAEAGDN
jgi:hypothetical protein